MSEITTVSNDGPKSATARSGRDVFDETSRPVEATEEEALRKATLADAENEEPKGAGRDLGAVARPKNGVS